VKNVVRRGVAQKADFSKRYLGRVAADWAVLYNKHGLARELIYYEQVSRHTWRCDSKTHPNTTLPHIIEQSPNP
jgi:hypothetical protein